MICKISNCFSILASNSLDGDAEALKYLYKNAPHENPPLLRTIQVLQDNLQTAILTESFPHKYSIEFLYYLAMICIGETTPLIIRNLGLAKLCLKMIKDSCPQAQARLAYIHLLESSEPAKSEENIYSLSILQQWACSHDFFSLIVLARISFDRFLDECNEHPLCLPAKAVQLLARPCHMGHPVAVRFWNDMLEFIGTPEALEKMISAASVNTDSLLDFKMNANLQIGP